MPTIDDVRAVKDVQGHVAAINGAVADSFGDEAVGVERLGLRLVHGQGEALPVQRRASDFVQASLKRGVDIAVSAVVLLATLPLIALVALAIVLDSRGPVFYRAERVGRGGRRLRMLKFRKMHHDASGSPLTMSEDSRFTRIGGLLARTKLDELPQLWHVLRGEMSLIGPRPTLRYQVDRYSERQRRRLEVKPGITGWAQIHGRASLPWAERIELDVWYVEHRSPRTDALILLRTPLALYGGTYKGETGGWKPG